MAKNFFPKNQFNTYYEDAKHSKNAKNSSNLTKKAFNQNDNDQRNDFQAIYEKNMEVIDEV